MTPSESAAVMLETRALVKSLGGLPVARGIDFRLERGDRHALIGPNGAGKTSFINLLTGALMPDSGEVLLGGEDVTSLPAEARVKRGIGRTFQINTLFGGLSALENVLLAVSERHGLGGAMLRSTGAIRPLAQEAHDLLERLGLAADAGRPVRTLAYGRQRLVEIALALALRPKVLFLDEPAAGLPSTETGIIIDTIESLPPDIAVLIIEHDMDLVFRLARRVTVLVQGAILLQGAPAEIAADPRVRAVYLGEGAAT
ncbi:MAG: ABC transporter ATP-binding protein [Alphaproteobacteria bacterium]|nr:ABC transporter ATP-binding protein [Alphaproteobacteria bacterium]